jgi:hypothetical protein
VKTREPPLLLSALARGSLSSVETSALSVLVLLLSDSLLSLEECLSVLVDLKLSDHAVRGVDRDLGRLA